MLDARVITNISISKLLFHSKLNITFDPFSLTEFLS